ncbi:30S ribosomal protein S7 [candidate division Kazan bacterium]|uniref:Small ribosomal subunit protein uS7 n=1 Tax=candidate division Kazan bacterium TaxID=2202143 RepID=A0A420ZE18_UNCK3|nr:MAG: 30S ribosomal protein S7 [candidate division Kazan bacterium]
MSRRKLNIKNEREPDRKYGHVMIGRLIRKVMLNGKKSVAEKIVYDALQEAAKRTNKDPIQVFEDAFNNIYPAVQLKSRRIGGANLQIPTEVKGDRKNVLALQWIVAAARARKGKPMVMRLADELVDAVNGTGGAVKKREETHRMAEANQAFAHYARF